MKPCPSRYSGYDCIPLYCDSTEHHIGDHGCDIDVLANGHHHPKRVTWLVGDH